MWNLLCQYNNIGKKNTNRWQKNVTTVATVPPGTVAIVQNLKKKKKEKKKKEKKRQSASPNFQSR